MRQGLLEAVPELREHVPKMAEHGKVWLRAAVVSGAADRAGDVLCPLARDSVGDVADCRERDGG